MTLTEVRQLLLELDLRPSKALGQNFLIDQNIRDLILHQADLRPDETVLEIGPGLGALTEELICQAGRFIAIEKDSRLCAHLRNRLPGLELVEGDATKVPLPACDKVVANLPYSVSTAVMERLVEGADRPRRMVLMLQREVAQRLVATPRHKDYGALTLFTQFRYHVTIAHIVSPSCFCPPPGVESAVIVFDRRDPRVALVPGAPFHALVRAGFTHRRKMLRSQLLEFGVTEKLLADVGAVPTARAEELSLDQWITLANAVRRSPA